MSNLSMRAKLEAGISARQTLLKILDDEVERDHEAALQSWFVYYLVDVQTRKVKIGYTKDLRRRYLEIHAMNSGVLAIFHYELVSGELAAIALETQLHHEFAEYRDVAPSHWKRNEGDREWYRIDGRLKCHMQEIHRRKHTLRLARLGGE